MPSAAADTARSDDDNEDDDDANANAGGVTKAWEDVDRIEAISSKNDAFLREDGDDSIDAVMVSCGGAKRIVALGCSVSP